MLRLGSLFGKKEKDGSDTVDAPNSRDSSKSSTLKGKYLSFVSYSYVKFQPKPLSILNSCYLVSSIQGCFHVKDWLPRCLNHSLPLIPILV